MAGDSEIFLQLIESQPLICDRFSNIQRIDKIGGGGAHSIVFTANDSLQKKNKKIVLKFFNPRLAEDFYRRECFQREGKILESLRGQRNILPLVKELTVISLNLDIPMGVFPIQFSFYASHKAKESVKNFIYGQEVSFLKNIHFFRQICRSVQRIHKRNIFHRDLKPDNFLIFPSGYVCLSDFGSARDFRDGVAILNEYESVEIGDPRYASFDIQCHLGNNQESQQRADFYSLGAILFEMFTKNILYGIIFQGDLTRARDLMRQVPDKDRLKIYNEVIKQIVIDYPLPSVRKVNPEIPKQVSIEVDKLYKSLSNLDFRKRETNFGIIFSKINLCEKLIKYNIFIERKRTRKK